MANNLTIDDYLNDHGYEIVSAHDGLEAIEKAEEIKPDIILMDIQMPTMNGLAPYIACARILSSDPRQLLPLRP